MGGNRRGENVLDDLRGDDFAGTAPGREGVEDDDLVILDGGFELGLAVCLSVSIHKKELGAYEGQTYFARLWTPILIAEDLNPL